MQMSNNNGSSADIDSHISKKYEIRRRLGKVTIMMMRMMILMTVMMMILMMLTAIS